MSIELLFCINQNFKYISLIDMTTNPSSLANNIEHQKKLMEMDLRLKLILPADIEKLEVNNLLDVLSKYQSTKSKYSKQLLKKKKYYQNISLKYKQYKRGH